MDAGLPMDVRRVGTFSLPSFLVALQLVFSSAESTGIL